MADQTNSIDNKQLLANNPQALAQAIEQVVAEMEALKFAERDLFHVRLALEESLANAMKHGNANDQSKRIRFAYRIDSSHTWFQIEDEGKGFSPDDVPDPTLDENIGIPSGRGVLLMKTFMDDVQFNDQGNCVTMRKARGTEE